MLADIGAADVPQWLIFNKVDRLESPSRPVNTEDVYEWDGRALPRVFLSAVTGEGMSVLRQRLAEFALLRQPDPGWGLVDDALTSPQDPAG